MFAVEIIKNQIIEFIDSEIKLKVAGSPESNSELLKKHLNARTELLRSFSLPDLKKYVSFINTNLLPTDFELNTIIEQLKLFAEEYLLAPVVLPADFLENAITNKTHWEEVFAYLAIPSDDYLIFIYSELLSKGRCSIDEFLKLTEIPVSKLNSIRSLANNFDYGFTQNYTEDPRYNFLGRTIPYLNLYLNFNRKKDFEKFLDQKKILPPIPLELFFWQFLNPYPEKKDELEKYFDKVADMFMNEVCIEHEHTYYRIIELEVYYFDKNIHPDPYAPCRLEDLVTGNIITDYLDCTIGDYKIDFTIGDYSREIYACIRIRGVKKLGKVNTYISGPYNVKKLFNMTFTSCLKKNESIIALKQIPTYGFYTKEIPIKKSRVDLTPISNDIEDFYKKKYRYIIEINAQHRFIGHNLNK